MALTAQWSTSRFCFSSTGPNALMLPYRLLAVRHHKSAFANARRPIFDSMRPHAGKTSLQPWTSSCVALRLTSKVFVAAPTLKRLSRSKAVPNGIPEAYQVSLSLKKNGFLNGKSHSLSVCEQFCYILSIHRFSLATLHIRFATIFALVRSTTAVAATLKSHKSQLCQRIHDASFHQPHCTFCRSGDIAQSKYTKQTTFP